MPDNTEIVKLEWAGGDVAAGISILILRMKEARTVYDDLVNAMNAPLTGKLTSFLSDMRQTSSSARAVRDALREINRVEFGRAHQELATLQRHAEDVGAALNTLQSSGPGSLAELSKQISKLESRRRKLAGTAVAPGGEAPPAPPTGEIITNLRAGLFKAGFGGLEESQKSQFFAQAKSIFASRTQGEASLILSNAFKSSEGDFKRLMSILSQATSSAVEAKILGPTPGFGEGGRGFRPPTPFMGNPVMGRYFGQFGMGQHTGIGIPMSPEVAQALGLKMAGEGVSAAATEAQAKIASGLGGVAATLRQESSKVGAAGMTAQEWFRAKQTQSRYQADPSIAAQRVGGVDASIRDWFRNQTRRASNVYTGFGYDTLEAGAGRGGIFSQLRAQGGFGTFSKLADEFKRLMSSLGSAGGGGGGIIDKFTSFFSTNGGLDNGKKKLDDVNNSWSRHTMWIIQGAVLWRGLSSIIEQATQFLQGFVEQERLAAQVAGTIGQSTSITRSSMLQNSAAGAAMGINPMTSMQSQLLISQTGATEEQVDQARRLFVVFGGDYNNILQEIIQTQNKADAAGIKHISVLDYMATSLGKVATNQKTVAGSLEVYFDALQSATSIAPKVGLGVEAVAQAIGRIAFTTEAGSAGAAGTMIENLLGRLQNPSVKEKLKLQFGIEEKTLSATLRRVVELYRAYSASGQQEMALRLIQTAYGGSLVGQKTINDARAVIDELGNALSGANDQLNDFGTLFGTVSDTTVQKINVLTASWNQFLLALGNTGPVRFVFDTLNKIFEGGTILLERAAQTTGTRERYESLTPDQQRQVYERAVAGGYVAPNALRRPGEYGLDTLASGKRLTQELFDSGGLLALMTQQETARMLAIQSAIDAVIGPPQNVLSAPPGSVSTGAQYPTSPLAPIDPADMVARLLRLPEKGTLAQFQKFYGEELKKIQAIPNYDVQFEQTAILSDVNDYLTQFASNSEAASAALQRMADEAKKAEEAFSMFGGIQDMPEGESFSSFQQRVNRITGQLRSQLPPEYAEKVLETKDVFFWDGGQLTKLTAPLQSIALANQELLKIEKQKIQGVFNVPDEGRVLIPFFALQSGFVPRDQLPNAETNGALTGLGGAADGTRDALERLKDKILSLAEQDMDRFANALANGGGVTGALRGALTGGQIGATTFGPPTGFDPYGQFQRESSVTIPITINNALVLDGAVVTIQRRIEQNNYNSLSSLSRVSSGGGARPAVAM